MYEVRTYKGTKIFRSKAKARDFLIHSGKKRYSALYKDNKLLMWKSPTGLR